MLLEGCPLATLGVVVAVLLEGTFSVVLLVPEKTVVVVLNERHLPTPPLRLASQSYCTGILPHRNWLAAEVAAFPLQMATCYRRYKLLLVGGAMTNELVLVVLTSDPPVLA